MEQYLQILILMSVISVKTFLKLTKIGNMAQPNYRLKLTAPSVTPLAVYNFCGQAAVPWRNPIFS